MLDEVQLLVARGDGEVVSGGCLIRTLRAKGRVGHHYVKPLAARNLVYRISQRDVGFKTMQVEIHQRETAGTCNQFLPKVRVGLQPFGEIAGQCSTLGFLDQPLVRRDQKSTRAARGITHRELFVSTRVGLHAPDESLNQDARCEVLPSPFLALAGGFFKQSLERSSLDVDVEGCPVDVVNQSKQLFEIDGLLNLD